MHGSRLILRCCQCRRRLFGLSLAEQRICPCEARRGAAATELSRALHEAMNRETLPRWQEKPKVTHARATARTRMRVLQVAKPRLVACVDVGGRLLAEARRTKGLDREELRRLLERRRREYARAVRVVRHDEARGRRQKS